MCLVSFGYVLPARVSDPYMMSLFSTCTWRVVVVRSWGRFSNFSSRVVLIRICDPYKCYSCVVVVRTFGRFPKCTSRVVVVILGYTALVSARLCYVGLDSLMLGCVELF